MADSYSLYNGKLCYIVEDRPKRDLRMLDLLEATNEELVVDIPTLVTFAVPESEGCRKYTFRVLYHAEGVTSCLYSFARPTTRNWLIIFNAQEHRLLGNIPLDSAIRIFVRNKGDHLFFGTHSEHAANGNRKWVLRHFNLRTKHLSRDKMRLTNVVGYEIGSTVCFEIFDQYFYGCSSSTAFELEEIDWTSYYYCFRFPIGEFHPSKSIQIMRKRDSWRRQHAEGPIDDRWSFLNLDQDEATGKIRIIECRKEWLQGSSGSIRTYYTTDVRFVEQRDAADNTSDPLPNLPITALLESTNRPKYMEAPGRKPLDYHPGDDGAALFSRSKTHLSSYHYACSTFLDLVDDPLLEQSSTQRLCIRTGARVFDGDPGKTATSYSPHVQQHTGESIEIKIPQHNKINMWPPKPTLLKPDPLTDSLRQLDQAMNPPGFTGTVAASSDGRSIVYSTSSGMPGDLKVIVYVSFDPSVRLAGVVQANRFRPDDVSSECHPSDKINDGVHPKGKGKATLGAVQWSRHEDSGMQKDSVASTSLPCVRRSRLQDLPARTLPASDTGPPFASIQDAMHQNLPGKFEFSERRYDGVSNR